MSNVKTQSSNEIFRNNNCQNPNPPPTVALKRLFRNGKMVKNVMLNQVLTLIQDLGFQHLIESMCYETLKRVQGDKK